MSESSDDRLAKIWAHDYESLTEQTCRRGLHVTWFVDSEDQVACPWCEIDRLTEQLDRQAKWVPNPVGCAPVSFSAMFRSSGQDA